MTGHARRPAATGTPQQADEELVMFLEPDQLLAGRERVVPRAQLSRQAKTALWILRVSGIILSAMIIYAFFSQLSM
jgi:hypothetical protein